MARFFQVDPVLQVERAQGDPQLWNRYTYAANNPLKHTDPTGRVIATGYAGLKALQDLLRDVGEEDLAKRLQLVTVSKQHSFLRFRWTTNKKTVVSSGDVDLSKSSNPVAALIGDAITTEVTVDFRLTSDDPR